ncbi:putative soyasaponin III rhamnosyltransferase [Helianthus annuus]|uniref:Putative UDP-Glycosyltransferase superfamily protein n=1 Tax=Helianthus annuus TaxID=4232 RepID=A0A251V1R6_HELAN|nr:UDP-glycosyltransferase 91C1 [Helianthus annuus]KAF5768993.1 putative soyasaponin III rhamnosyltransferase [Helianthus annuus]KAJ0464122.1 putative soyasaponin III rhamnosyltransferase [Helianthus annuus]KAJ0485667.1 putative soyasaponin III rhamnosyltransferase [Helianthus annuus]KAJ0656220.1 putative soyasaponin III rhamnosyltransferase [Helianthus annuus]KAJ0659882.1 putative soyasaponin III rhamnosyltransferase [Helianthus annuus]
MGWVSASSMEQTRDEKGLHIVMFPWLAMGHLIPFFHFSKILAQKGHQISFISTPRNLDRIPKIPPKLSHNIKLVSLPFPKVESLPEHAESSMDIPYQKAQFLKIAFDLLEPLLLTFLQTSTPRVDWIIFDYASHWVPSLASRLGVSTAYFSLFTAATQAFLGPPSLLLNAGQVTRSAAEDYCRVPEWVPFKSDIVYRLHEVTKYTEGAVGNESGTSDTIRFLASIDGCDLVLFRTSYEFEPEWFDLVCELYQKPVIPIGVLPPSLENDDGIDENWDLIKKWLDEQQANSVVYVALGSEAVLSQIELSELALGLERSGLPFFWVIRKSITESAQLPNGFLERIKGHGVVNIGWVPQVRILSHSSIGGFLTHCGWNSAIEGLTFGRVLIFFPVMNDQGLNVRLLSGKKLGVEIPRNVKDGSFTSDSVAESIKLAMVSEEGEALRENAREMKVVFGNKSKNDHYIDASINHLVKMRKPCVI